MKFEEALQALRDGEKVTHPFFEEDEYFIARYHGLISMNETLEQLKERGMFMTKMKGDKLHPDNNPRIDFSKPWHSPCIPIILLMSESWDTLKLKHSYVTN